MANDAGKTRVLVICALIGLSIGAVWGWSMYFIGKGEREALGAKTVTQNQKIALLTTDVNSLNRERRALALNLSDTKAERNDLRASRKTLELTLGQLKDMSLELEANLGRIKEEHTDLQIVKDELASNLDKTKTERDSLDASLKSAESEKTRMEVELKELLFARDQLDSALEKSQGEKNQLKSELDAKIKAKEAELSESSLRIENLNTKLKDANQKIVDLEQDVQALQKERDEIKFQFAELEKKLESEVQSKNITIEQLKNDLTIIRIPGDILFDSGSVQLKDAGLKALGHIASTLNRFPDRKVSLEGHTDSIPISSLLQQKYASNWELSAGRAASAVRYLQSQGIEPRRLRAIGYGEHRPVADNEDVELRSRNRRLEIRLLPSEEIIVEQTLEGL